VLVQLAHLVDEVHSHDSLLATQAGGDCPLELTLNAGLARPRGESHAVIDGAFGERRLVVHVPARVNPDAVVGRDDRETRKLAVQFEDERRQLGMSGEAVLELEAQLFLRRDVAEDERDAGNAVVEVLRLGAQAGYWRNVGIGHYPYPADDSGAL